MGRVWLDRNMYKSGYSDMPVSRYGMQSQALREKVCDKVKREYNKLKKYEDGRFEEPETRENGDKTQFYSCVVKYFRYKRNIQEVYLRLMLRERSPIAAMWDIYLKSEVPDYHTWQEIDEILKDMLCYQEVCLAS